MGQEVGMAERTLKLALPRCHRPVAQCVFAESARGQGQKLLLATDQSIKAIAYEVGYENVSFFVRVFKTHAGQTPALWRQGEAQCQHPAP